MAKRPKRKRARRRRGGGTRGERVSERVLIEGVVGEIRRRATEAQDPATPPDRVAAIVAEDFDGMPAPLGLVRMLAERGSPERAGVVVERVALLAPGSVTALTLQAEAARVLEGDRERAERLLDEALDAGWDPSARVMLGGHLLEADRAVEALELAGEELLDNPLDGPAQTLYAQALVAVHARGVDGEELGPRAHAALERFRDRTPIYQLRAELARLVESDPELLRRQAETVREWLEDTSGEDRDLALELTGAEGERPGTEQEAIAQMAIERSWLMEPDDDLDENDDGDEQAWLERDEGDPDLSESRSPVALLARAENTSAEVADVAADWHQTCSYGLWLVGDPRPAPGVWLTEIVCGARRYVEVAPEQLDGLACWSVLLGAIVSLGGTWHTTGTFISLSPAEGDAAASLVSEAATDLLRVLSGKRARGPRRRRADPFGVLAGVSDEPDPPFADLVSKITANLLPAIAGGIRQQRAAAPRLTNTDGHPLKMITALVAIEEEASTGAARRLAAHPDFTCDEDGIGWWGRELTAAEREQTLHSVRAQLQEAEEEELEIEEPEEPRRWLRGRLRPAEGGFEVGVNSEERLQSLLERLAELGFSARLERRSVIDPSQDLPLRGPLGPLGFGDSPAEVDIWARHWPRQPTPALGGLTPRAAASRERERPRLEAVLRTLEHDADHISRRDRPVPDFHRLRAELSMERWWERPAGVHHDPPSRRRRR